ncbi:hypothetical protein AERO9AM_10004 [Aeromicrobium sp. 9AM]|nr:hypothetical protein AERO9AM_10004 [Aeromicrobium sp. 9AM]
MTSDQQLQSLVDVLIRPDGSVGERGQLEGGVSRVEAGLEVSPQQRSVQYGSARQQQHVDMGINEGGLCIENRNLETMCLRGSEHGSSHGLARARDRASHAAHSRRSRLHSVST